MFDHNGWIVDDLGFDELRDVFDLNTLPLSVHHGDVIVAFDDCDVRWSPPLTAYRLNEAFVGSLYHGAGGIQWLLNEPDDLYVGHLGQSCYIAECLLWTRCRSELREGGVGGGRHRGPGIAR